MTSPPSDLRYPIGKFKLSEAVTETHMQTWMKEIADFPEQLKTEVYGLSDVQLAWPYRPEGWNISQVIHHCADSHMNCVIRFKLALTEEAPTIKPYFEGRWAQLPDMSAPVEWSLNLLEGLHLKWAYLLRQMSAEEYERTFVHPEHGKAFTLKEALGMYAWHSNHHLAHVRQAKQYRGTFNLA
ncbi:MAG: YfiT family bacillithiol transferase [Cyclobacteriaceae bacterium]